MDLGISGLGLNLVGTLLLARGLLRTNKQIEELARAYSGKNPYQVKAMKKDRTFAAMGLGVLALGFATQLLSKTLGI